MNRVWSMWLSGYKKGTIEFGFTGDELYARMKRAVEKVNERLRKTVRIIQAAKIPYAVIGGHAVRAWVAPVDEAAVRTSWNVDVLVRQEDLPSLISAMTKSGFYYRQTAGLDTWDGENLSRTR